ncbi:MAG: hypothetical protein AAFN78_01045 [Pseudomonadota bacterium]
MTDELKDIFDSNFAGEGETPVAVSETPNTEADQAQKAAASETPTGEDVTTEAAADTEAQAQDAATDDGGEKPSEEPQSVPLAALKSEREKRQAAEALANDASAANARLQEQLVQALSAANKGQESKAEKPADPFKDVDFLDNPEGAKQAITSLMDSGFKQQNEAMQQQIRTFSEMIARSKYDDYDEKVDAFKKAAQAQLNTGDSTLLDQFKQHPNPGEFVYQTGRDLALLTTANGDLSALLELERQKAVEAYKQEIAKQVDTKKSEQQESAPTIPPASLATQVGAGETATQDTGFQPLGEVFASHF